MGASDNLDFDPNDLDYLLNEEEHVNQSMFEDIIQAEEQYRREEKGDNASSGQIVAAFDEAQSKLVSLLGPNTFAHYFTDLAWKYRNDVKQWFIDKGINIKCALVLGRRSSRDRLELVCERGETQKSHWAQDTPYVKKTTREYMTKSKKFVCSFKIIVNRPNDKPHQLETIRSMKACKPNDIPRKIKNNLSTLRQIYAARAATDIIYSEFVVPVTKPPPTPRPKPRFLQKC
ncbi:uncharacterized protein LOC113279260 [Papaver somniferum]|uniref:uncharacterized protein LOC113279260 n=1 Tax=Papaver somniferum TaxID=3469 RepID=UPI000E70307D|nr:uncharacterized protein LOC113279260 [Papaver somniferum]